MEVSCKRRDEDTLSKLSNHLKLKLGRNHVLGAINGDNGRDKHKQEDRCKKHATEAIKYYFRNDDRVVCGDCIVSDHMTCKTEFISELGKQFEESSEFKNLLGQIEKWEADKESAPRIESNRKKNHALFDNAITEIKKFRREINTLLDKMEKNIEAEVRKISDENEKHLSELEKKIRNISDEIVKIKEDLDTNVYQADSLFIRRVESQPKINTVAKAMLEFKSDNAIKCFSNRKQK